MTASLSLLDLFSGEGAIAVGYARAGWNVEGVDNSKARLKHYPFRSHLADALEFAVKYGHNYDAIHASPTCTGYSRGTAALPDRLEKYDRLIGATRDVLVSLGVPYVIENVEDAKPELLDPVRLCWSYFFEPGSVLDTDGTPLQMRRHRLFESSAPLVGTPCRHAKDVQVAGSYGGARRDKWEARHVRKGGYVPASIDVQRELLGTPWMTGVGCRLSVPPAYGEYIGKQLMAHTEARVSV